MKNIPLTKINTSTYVRRFNCPRRPCLNVNCFFFLSSPLGLDSLIIVDCKIYDLFHPINISHFALPNVNSDPKTFEMLQKIQTLQKRLIQKTSEVVEKELKIQEKERQFVELKVSACDDVLAVYNQYLRNEAIISPIPPFFFPE